MTTRCSTAVTTTVVAALLLVGCAHAPDRVEGGADYGAAPPVARAERVQVFVTGSRIAQWIDPTSPIPATTSPVKIYSRGQVLSTGRYADLGAALQQLDPSIGLIHR